MPHIGTDLQDPWPTEIKVHCNALLISLHRSFLLRSIGNGNLKNNRQCLLLAKLKELAAILKA